jgi:hypothetical protein
LLAVVEVDRKIDADHGGVVTSDAGRSVAMKFLHFAIQSGPHRTVIVTLDKQANVKVMDDFNFESYKSGDGHKFYGGYATKSPFKVVLPSPGMWHVVIDLGGIPGSVRASVRMT